LTFDAIARRLRFTKQAVIYWFPTKEDLVREISLSAVEAEAETTIAALDGAKNAGDAIGRFVRALVAHHLADLGRFRVTYLAVQLSPRPDLIVPRDAIMTHIYPVTSRMYGALEAVFAADPAFPKTLVPRRAAVVVHTSALGLIVMLSLANSIADPLAHATEDLIATLVAMLGAGARPVSGARAAPRRVAGGAVRTRASS
jgi:AcrR family transcriptional regulator